MDLRKVQILVGFPLLQQLAPHPHVALECPSGPVFGGGVGLLWAGESNQQNWNICELYVLNRLSGCSP